MLLQKKNLRKNLSIRKLILQCTLRLVLIAFIGLVLNFGLFSSFCLAEETSRPDSLQNGLKGERLEVDFADGRYWELSQSGASRVLFNRKFSTTGKFELAGSFGTTNSDPFLQIYNVGLKLGYYISEEFQLEVLGWKHMTSGSGALTALRTAGSTANTNPPQFFVGAGVEYTPVYGKLSFFGLSILRYNLSVLAGIGATGTETGINLTAYAGVSQMFFVTQDVGISFDYKMTFYDEAIREKANPARLGQYNFNQLNQSDIFSFGISVFI